MAIIFIAGIAATPAQLAQPNQPTVTATANGGEIVISWDSVPGAQYYTVGWINWTDAKPLADAGQDWLSRFNYTTVRGNVTSHTVEGLVSGDDYYAIIRATDTGARFGGGYSRWSAWSSAPVQPAGQHGEGFCPITGLPLPPGGYLSVGETATFGNYSITVDRVETPESVTLVSSDGTEEDREPHPGRRWLYIYVKLDNDFDFLVTLDPGRHYILSTDAGNGFSWSGPHDLEPGYIWETLISFDIPADATTAVLAVRPLLATSQEADNAPQLFNIAIPVAD